MKRSSKRYKAYQKILDNPYTALEILDVYLGELIGQGSSRWVFDYNEDTVLKVEKKDWNANAIEYDTWLAVQGTKWEKWFAPVVDISSNGRLLWMKKCEPLEREPKKVPNFLYDLRIDNLGMYNGHVVTLDYSINTITENGLKGGKLVPFEKLKII